MMYNYMLIIFISGEHDTSCKYIKFFNCICCISYKIKKMTYFGLDKEIKYPK